MSHIREVRTLIGESVQDLDKQINDFLLNGWEGSGSFIIEPDRGSWYYQRMILL